MMHSNYHMLIHLAWHGPEEVLDPAPAVIVPVTVVFDIDVAAGAIELMEEAAIVEFIPPLIGPEPWIATYPNSPLPLAPHCSSG